MIFENHFGLFKWYDAVWYLEPLDQGRFSGYQENEPQVIGSRWLGGDAESSWDGHREWDADIIATFYKDKIILREGIWGDSPEDALDAETELTEYSFSRGELGQEREAVSAETIDSLLIHLQVELFENSDELLEFVKPTFADSFGGKLDNSPEYYRKLFLEQFQKKGLVKKAK